LRVSILQPSYLPWLGYFEQMQFADAFVFLNDVQYTKSDWRNRNRIKTERGASWITVPVRRLSSKQKIDQALVNNDRHWTEDHENLLEANYRKAPYFREVLEILKHRWALPHERLQDLTIGLTRDLAGYLGIRTPFYLSSDFKADGSDPNLRLVQLCKAMNADEFYEGKSGQDYLDSSVFEREGIRVVFQNYRHPCYRQFYGDFVSHLSIVDLLFHHGPSSLEIVTSGHGLAPGGNA